MSYCRFIEADVYVYEDVNGYYNCCGCIRRPGSFHTPKAEEMAEHLREHIAVGDYVPPDVIPAIIADGDIDGR